MYNNDLLQLTGIGIFFVAGTVAIIFFVLDRWRSRSSQVRYLLWIGLAVSSLLSMVGVATYVYAFSRFGVSLPIFNRIDRSAILRTWSL